MTTEQPNTPATPAPNTTSTSTAQEGSPKREYTQTELDQLFNERATRAAAAATSKVLKALGVDSEAQIPDLKSLIDKAREREAQDLSVTERAQKDIDAAKKRADLLEQQLATEKSARRAQAINSSIRDAVKAAPDADLVLMYLRQSHAEEVEALLADDADKVDADKLKKLVDAAKKEKPILFSSAVGNPGSPSASGGRVMSNDTEAQRRAHQSNQRLIRG